MPDAPPVVHGSSGTLRTMGRGAARLRLATLPPAELQTARKRVLDTLGCLVAGYETEIRFGRALHPHAFLQATRPMRRNVTNAASRA